MPTWPVFQSYVKAKVRHSSTPFATIPQGVVQITNQKSDANIYALSIYLILSPLTSGWKIREMELVRKLMFSFWRMWLQHEYIIAVKNMSSVIRPAFKFPTPHMLCDLEQATLLLCAPQNGVNIYLLVCWENSVKCISTLGIVPGTLTDS